MPSTTDEPDVPPRIATLARRYRRLDRLLRIGLVVVLAVVIVTVVVALPFLPAVVLLLLLLVLLRAPLFAVSGTMELETSADPESVQADFEGATPPVLTFQWAVADAVHATSDGSRYEFSYLFGLRSVEMTTEVESDPDAGTVTLESRTDDHPWGTYTVTIKSDDEDGTTTVTVASRSDRRFELARLAQLVAASRYQPAVLEAQGYDVVDRDRSLQVWPRGTTAGPTT